VLVAGTVIKRSPEPGNRFGGIVTIVGIAIVGLALLSSTFKIIEPGKVGVQTLFGKVEDQVLESGLHIINPFVEVTTYSVQTENYTMSAKSSEGPVEGDDAIRVLSSDGLEVTIDLSVLYKVIPSRAPFIMQNIGNDYVDKIVRPVTRTAIRDNAVSYAAVDLFFLDEKGPKNQVSRDASLPHKAFACKADKTTGCIILLQIAQAIALAKRRYAPSSRTRPTCFIGFRPKLPV
jgi:regulator of protease activity HflC (stomatin/prohibitin superfamily)